MSQSTANSSQTADPQHPQGLSPAEPVQEVAALLGDLRGHLHWLLDSGVEDLPQVVFQRPRREAGSGTNASGPAAPGRGSGNRPHPGGQQAPAGAIPGRSGVRLPWEQPSQPASAPSRSAPGPAQAAPHGHGGASAGRPQNFTQQGVDRAQQGVGAPPPSGSRPQNQEHPQSRSPHSGAPAHPSHPAGAGSRAGPAPAGRPEVRGEPGQRAPASHRPPPPGRPSAPHPAHAADGHGASLGHRPPEAPAQGAAAARLRQIREEMGDCRRCRLSRHRNRLVFGQGNPQAELVFVGEAPGYEEDLSGAAFVGRAGDLLTAMIKAMGYSREEVYICNIVKCRPPNNRRPQPDEVDVCRPFVEQQLEAIRPKVIVALGATASQALLRTNTGIVQLRNRWTEWRGIPVMPTFHPAYLLRAPGEKGKTWADLQLVMQRLGKPVAPRSGGGRRG